MSYRSRHRSFRRMVLGLVFASVIYAGGVSAAPPGVGQLIDRQDLQVSDDPYLSDIYVRPGEALGGPDGGPVVSSTTLRFQNDVEWMRIEHALEAQELLSGYMDRD
jgi:hypothetical protein